MKNLRTLLRDGDPIAHEPPLSSDEVEWMRHVVLTTKARPRIGPWVMRVAVASAFGLVAGAGIWWNTTAEQSSHAYAAKSASAAPAAPGERRQLQVTTPGGTRVIWVFDSNFDMR
jgi:hypothetical protein